jgi:hypothetical protein
MGQRQPSNEVMTLLQAARLPFRSRLFKRINFPKSSELQNRIPGVNYEGAVSSSLPKNRFLPGSCALIGVAPGFACESTLNKLS